METNTPREREEGRMKKDDPSEETEATEAKPQERAGKMETGRKSPDQNPEMERNPYDEAGYKECFSQFSLVFGQRFNSLCTLTSGEGKDVGDKHFNVDLKSGRPDHKGVSYKPGEIMEELKAGKQEIETSTDYFVSMAYVKEVILPGNAQKKKRLSYNIRPRLNHGRK